LFRVIAKVAPDRRLLAADIVSWDDVMSLLAASGDGGRIVGDAIRGGTTTQRALLQDADLDGLVTLDEMTRGLDPWVWDTDGDGWWDGAPADRPPHAIPLTKAAACLDWASSTGSTRVSLEGNLRGIDLRGEGFVAEADHLILPHPTLSKRPGGYYLVPTADDLAPNGRCRQSRDWLVVAKGSVAEEHLDRFTEALAEARPRFEAFGVEIGRFVVVAERDVAGVMAGTPSMSVALEVLADGEEVESLAYLLAAAYTLHASGHRSASNLALMVAFRDDVLGVKGPLFGARIYRPDVKHWQREVARCGGWEPFLERRCR
jgi:hypothetical protein